MLRFLILLMLAPLPAAAKTKACLTSVNGADVALSYDTAEPVFRDNLSYRDWLLGGFGKITCPGYVTLRHLTPEQDDETRAVFCLNYDREAKTYTGLSLGKRDAYLTCRKPTKTLCERVNENAETALALGRLGNAVATGATDAAIAAGVSVLTDQPSGAVIIEGERGFLERAVGAIGQTAVTVLTAPEQLTASAVSLVVVGGAVYVCGG